MKLILDAKNIKVQYGEVETVKNVDIKVPIGESVALIGPNGAGKTTLLKAISGVLPVTGGSIKYLDKEVGGKPSHSLSKNGISMIPEGRLPFSSMTVKENLMLPTYSMKLPKNEVEEQLAFVYDLFPILKERGNQKAGNLSGGEQQMMVISRALMMKPRILLIDEPALGLAPVIVGQIYDVIPKLLNSGLSILLVEQSSELALSVCSYVYVMREGKIVHSNKSKNIKKSELTDYYLG